MAKSITIDHTQPLVMTVEVPTVSVVTALLTHTIGNGKERVFFDGPIGNKEPVRIGVGTLPAGTAIKLWFGIGGPLKARYKITIELSQQGDPVKDGGFALADNLDGEGLAFPEEEIQCP